MGQDGDFQTLRNLLNQNALGKVMEAELHYDFEAPPWLKYMTKEKYEPGDGHVFGLGMTEPPFSTRSRTKTHSSTQK
jgi:predicted dehydrogenase